ncbi:MAG: nucleotidyltransferase domain-containing protein [archaeon YNP-LCB-003-016]|nr:nucleotidyltransferase domain-containing protein [Candidatus Culexarchaeum yellowstonense]MCR6692713.1 nucleotidyltransferase domain-containing protein [Candidatus Culexarchaeum yellowstonense]
MWEDLLIDEAKRRSEIFERLDEYLKKIVETVKKLDSNAEVYLFGSVAEGNI